MFFSQRTRSAKNSFAFEVGVKCIQKIFGKNLCWSDARMIYCLCVCKDAIARHPFLSSSVSSSFGLIYKAGRGSCSR